MNAYLVLETGEIFPGKWHGGRERAGEVVFNTSHSGYEEIATDPSYYSQIVVMTNPMQGNYSVDSKVWESQRVWIEGFICLQIQNSKRDNDWIQRLNESSVPLVSEIDTRNLVLRLRSGGTSWGALVQAETEVEAQQSAAVLIQKSKNKAKDWVWEVSRKEKEVRTGQMQLGPKIAVLDFGSKENILRELEKYCRELHLFSSRASYDEIQKINPDGLMLTNGPGDPGDVEVAQDTIRAFLGKKPIFGICMGHQVLALALGAQTYKLKFGHRGSNHPIRDEMLNKIYMSSQNHGYAVDSKTLTGDLKVTQVNLNDNTLAGFYSEKLKCLGIQFHPEACPGPHEAQALFRYFIDQMMN